ncbi:hypothetical protein [Pseudomonas sp.]|uniref:hypothetical protein n=1 Tax=Pseudomonas sp. TaxID=306 RepID=UPI003C70932F
MQEQALLTQAELAFIRQLYQPGAAAEQRSPPRLAVSIGKPLSIHAQVANQHLTFDLRENLEQCNQPYRQRAAPHG